MASVSGRLVKPLLDNEVVGPTLLREAEQRFGLTRADIEAPDARVDHEITVELIELAIRTTGFARMGLYGAMAMGTQIFHVLEYMVRTSPTVLEALLRVTRYNKLFHDGFVLDIERTPQSDSIRIGVKPGLRFTPAIAEFSMACFFIGGYDMGLPANAVAVYFTHDEPDDLRLYEHVFRVPMHFGAGVDRAVFPAGAFDQRLPAADPVLHEVLQRHAEQMLERMPRTTVFGERVRTLLTAELRGGNPTLKHIASVLSMSPRTLRRRLEDDGLTFHSVLDALRKDLAMSYLDEPDIGLEEAAFLLGYSEASAFRRAFRRWTGMTVSAHRKR